jgi:hypothetical protein
MKSLNYLPKKIILLSTLPGIFLSVETYQDEILLSTFKSKEKSSFFCWQRNLWKDFQNEFQIREKKVVIFEFTESLEILLIRSLNITFFFLSSVLLKGTFG